MFLGCEMSGLELMIKAFCECDGIPGHRRESSSEIAGKRNFWRETKELEVPYIPLRDVKAAGLTSHIYNILSV